MGIAQRCVRDEQALFFFCPSSKFLRAKFFQELTRAFWRIDVRKFRERCSFECFGRLLSFYLRIAVEDDVTEIRKQLCRAVATLRKAEKFRVKFEKICSDVAVAKAWMVYNVFNERNIGLHTTNSKFA